MNKDQKIALVRQLLDSETWPEIYRSEFLKELNDLADACFEKQSIEGYMSSLLIYHQIAEEMVKALIKVSTFYIQIKFLEMEYKDKEIDGKMFGQLITMLDGCLKISETDSFIMKCNELNAVRIKIVHKLTKKPDIDEIGKVCRKSKKLFDKIFELFAHIYDNWRVSLNEEKKYHEVNPKLIEEILGEIK